MPGAIQATAAIVTILAGVIVYLFERLRNRNSRFDKCSSDLYSENETAQITSAILLRSFLKYRSYRADALNLISALLRVLPNGNLQKTLGDGLSFVTYADGQDFQGANLSKVSIKSSDRVRYEISGKKKYKNKNFAAGCSREVIERGAQMLGWDLNKLIELTILAMRSCEDNYLSV